MKVIVISLPLITFSVVFCAMGENHYINASNRSVYTEQDANVRGNSTIIQSMDQSPAVDTNATTANLHSGNSRINESVTVNAAAKDPAKRRKYQDAEKDENNRTNVLIPDRKFGGIQNGRPKWMNDPIKLAPEYMLELYETFSKNPSQKPASDIVRSFKLSKHTDHYNYGNLVRMLPKDTEESFSFYFNVTSINLAKEIVVMSEIHFRTKMLRQPKDCSSHYVTRIAITKTFFDDNDIDTFGMPPSVEYIYGESSQWEVLRVTSFVSDWLQYNTNHRVMPLRINFKQVFGGCKMKIVIESKDVNHIPFLLVYSNEKENNVNDVIMARAHEMGNNWPESELDDTESVLMEGSGDNYVYDNDELPADNEIQSFPVKFASHKRNKRGSKHRIGRRRCRKRGMYVDFEEINWSSWIIAPKGYHANECIGRCVFPMSDHLDPTNHAVIQSILHSVNPRKISRSCCVPIKLRPISILYIDDKGIPTFKYRYKDMTVGACGCR